MNKFEKSDYLYTSLFCEENIWHLAKSLIDKEEAEVDDINIIFITNKNKQIAVFNQLAAGPKQAVIWDYHVILMAKIDQSLKIFDFDTRLAFSNNYEDYLKKSFPDNINPDYMSQFRIIPAKNYLNYFHSDRSHMKNIISEADFPKYPAILSNSVKRISLNNLFEIEKEIEHTFVVQNTKEIKNCLGLA